MASTRDIRRRIKSISSTAQITKAMQMVAASKMRKAQQAALDARPFARAAVPHPAAAPRRSASTSRIRCSRCARCSKRAVILVAADKGLCGALNSNVFRVAAQFDPATTVFITAGRKARAVRRPHAAAAGRRVRATATLRLSPRRGRSPTFARDLFLKGEVDEVHDRRHALRQHADPGAGRHRVPADRRDHRV